MPLRFVISFVCNRCGTEHNAPLIVNVQQFPAAVQLGVKQPPPGWTVQGTEARCPEHSRILVPVPPMIVPPNGSRG
jgi:hypothetical protein